ncbi:MAG: LysM peptidoglycan-binding domain-containing protein [Lachnospiraceae bacterium]|nr:LysM peptidoglycan-binding domain-containing protein [Lachnospiraceae bacterium]
MMDRQQFDRKEIPVNARAVGNPMGMNVLYLEDYVHTFIKKLIKNDEDENGCEVFLYGYEFDEEGKHFLVVSGAYQHESRYDRPEKVGAQFFPMSQYLGAATIHSDGVSEMNMEVIREGTRSIVFKNFYIYYDQNEEMQNYLIEWNLEHRDYCGRIEREDSVRYGRIAQAYNKEEVRVSFLWNAMNVLSIGFVVCIVVYGIVSMNNYHKMKNMEDKLSYIVTTMTENQDFVEVSALLSEQSPVDTQEEMEVFQTEIIEEITSEEYEMTAENSTEKATVAIEETAIEEFSTELVQEPLTIENMIEPDMTAVSDDAAILAKTAAIPQYYVVQQGDTLRSICISVYGNLDSVEEVCSQNGITNPDSILCGQTLLLP